jgi:ABC-type phosphate/phosphonate transport system substrate-binding protein
MFIDKPKRTLRPAINAVTILLTLYVLAACLPLLAQKSPGKKDEGLNIGFTVSAFAGVNTTDALAATKAWAGALVQKKGYSFSPQTFAFNTIDEAAQAAKEKKLDLAICLTSEYWTIKNSELEPHFICSRHGRIEDEALILAHRQSAIQKLDDLQGKDILISNTTGSVIGKFWLENILMSKGFGSLNYFFRNAGTTSKDSQAVLPVFFRKSDSCLIIRGYFEVISELNPQIRNDLKIVAQSPPFPISMVCIRKSYDREQKEALLEALENLHTDPKGQQILTLFKTDRLVPYSNASLARVAQLLTEHEKLTEQARGR